MRLAQCAARRCDFRAAQVALLYFTTMILLFAACIAGCFGASIDFRPHDFPAPAFCLGRSYSIRQVSTTRRASRVGPVRVLRQE
jgi:hypothetical protein